MKNEKELLNYIGKSVKIQSLPQSLCAHELPEEILKGLPALPRSNPKGGSAATFETSTGHILESDTSRLFLFLPEVKRKSSSMVLILPGGGYQILSFLKEGVDIARYFNSMGVAAAVLQYRIPKGNFLTPLSDVWNALTYLKDNAEQLNINPKKIGIMGFSAGGHLAALATTLAHSKKHFPTSILPSFQILMYPVISMLDDDICHNGSRHNLLGAEYSSELQELCSPEVRCEKKSPHCFLAHADDDLAVNSLNSLYYYEALKKNKVSADLYIFKDGGHGFGFIKHNKSIDNIPELLKEWLKAHKII